MLETLKGIIQVIMIAKDAFVWLKSTFGDNWQKYLNDTSDAFRKLKEADTQEKKFDAAKDIQDLIRRLGAPPTG